MVVIYLLLVVFLQNSCGQTIICSNANVTCTDFDLVKIYWDLNGIHQEDPKLIDFIIDRIDSWTFEEKAFRTI